MTEIVKYLKYPYEIYQKTCPVQIYGESLLTPQCNNIGDLNKFR